jgi:hypothetical protein
MIDETIDSLLTSKIDDWWSINCKLVALCKEKINSKWSINVLDVVDNIEQIKNAWTSFFLIG